MEGNWKILRKIKGKDINANNKHRTRFVIEEGKPVLIVEEKAGKLDITSECYVELVKSQNSSGFYVAIKHADKIAAIIGFKGVQAKSGFKVEPAYNATFSFRVFEVS